MRLDELAREELPLPRNGERLGLDPRDLVEVERVPAGAGGRALARLTKRHVSPRRRSAANRWPEARGSGPAGALAGPARDGRGERGRGSSRATLRAFGRGRSPRRDRRPRTPRDPRTADRRRGAERARASGRRGRSARTRSRRGRRRVRRRRGRFRVTRAASAIAASVETGSTGIPEAAAEAPRGREADAQSRERAGAGADGDARRSRRARVPAAASARRTAGSRSSEARRSPGSGSSKRRPPTISATAGFGLAVSRASTFMIGMDAAKCRARDSMLARVSATTPGRVTPMLRQYFEMKNRVPDAILLYRMGDFYEMFFDDAQDAAPLLGIALTRAQPGLGHRGADVRRAAPERRAPRRPARRGGPEGRHLRPDRGRRARPRASSAATSPASSRPGPCSTRSRSLPGRPVLPGRARSGANRTGASPSWISRRGGFTRAP